MGPTASLLLSSPPGRWEVQAGREERLLPGALLRREIGTRVVSRGWVGGRPDSSRAGEDNRF